MVPGLCTRCLADRFGLDQRPLLQHPVDATLPQQAPLPADRMVSAGQAWESWGRGHAEMGRSPGRPCAGCLPAVGMVKQGLGGTVVKQGHRQLRHGLCSKQCC